MEQIKKIGKFDFCAKYFYDNHYHREIEINYINSGNCFLTINHKNIPLHKGDCLYISSMVNHNFKVDEQHPCQITQLEFICDDFDFAISGQEFLKKGYVKVNNCNDIYESINCLYKYNNSIATSEYYKKLFSLELSKLSVLFTINARDACYEKQYTNTAIEEIIDYIDNNFEQPIDFENISKKKGISSRFLRKFFLQNMNVSPIEYLTLLRIDKAKDLLRNSNEDVSKIALDTGYNSPQYFSLTFRKQVGITPRDFREQYKL